MLDPFIPSLIIAASTVAAFLVGRIVAWMSVRAHVRVVVRWLVLLFAIAVALFFWFSPSSRYTLLLPAAFAMGFFTCGTRRFVPGVFDGKD